MPNHAKVLSVGIPVFNQGSTLTQTLDSLLNQIDQPLEIVVSENHSTDSTTKVLENYTGKIRIIRPPRHLSMMENFNFVVENLSAPWFAILSGDDFPLPHYTRELSTAAVGNPEAVLIRGGVEMISSEGRLLSRSRLLSVPRISRPPRNLLEQRLYPKVCFASFACRRDAWEKVGGFPQDIKRMGDWIFWLKIAPLGSFIRIPKILARYRTSTYIKNPQLVIESDLRIISKYLPEIFGPYLTQSDVLALQRARFDYVLACLAECPQFLDSLDIRSKIENTKTSLGFTNSLEEMVSQHLNNSKGIFGVKLWKKVKDIFLQLKLEIKLKK